MIQIVDCCCSLSYDSDLDCARDATLAFLVADILFQWGEKWCPVRGHQPLLAIRHAFPTSCIIWFTSMICIRGWARALCGIPLEWGDRRRLFSRYGLPHIKTLVVPTWYIFMHMLSIGRCAIVHYANPSAEMIFRDLHYNQHSQISRTRHPLAVPTWYMFAHMSIFGTCAILWSKVQTHWLRPSWVYA